jgi:hypothetical protein
MSPAADSRLRGVWITSESWRLHLCHRFTFLSHRRPVDSHIFNPGYALIDRSMLPANRDTREAHGKPINDNGISILVRVTSTSGCSNV